MFRLMRTAQCQHLYGKDGSNQAPHGLQSVYQCPEASGDMEQRASAPMECRTLKLGTQITCSGSGDGS